MPLPLPAATDVIALAIDSSEQGLPAPDHMLLRNAFRTVRAALRDSQDRSFRRMKEERDGDN